MSDSPLFLIAHLVRGEPAFDIATRLGILDEDGDLAWIIPTSGHRAYPSWAEPLDHFVTLKDDMIHWISDKPAFGYGTSSVDFSACPDHYPHSASPTTTPRPSLIESLNLAALRPVAAPIKRRV